jgi:hypothetical protein
MVEKENTMYFKGVFYSNEEDFWRAVNQYAKSPASPLTLKNMLADLEVDLRTNIFDICEYKITNNELSEIISDCLPYVMNKVRKERENACLKI